ncbi:MAG: right-handed parallel beta-helix repeat-containing protein [Methanosarcina sp.]
MKITIMGIPIMGGYFLKLANVMIVTFLFLLSTGVGSAQIFYVDPGNSIQAAVNNSTAGDLILVKPGEYRENIVVNISGLTVSSEFGNPDEVIIRARDRNSSVFRLTADNITIRGFNITGLEEPFNVSQSSNMTGNLNITENSDSGYNSTETGKNNESDKTGNFNKTAETDGADESHEINETEMYDSAPDEAGSEWNEIGCLPAGICLELADNCTIEKNNLSDNQFGIYIQNSMNTTLSENNFSRNSVWLEEWCAENLLVNNTIEGSSLILGANCWNNTISQNKLLNGEGISIACCGGNNIVAGNEIINCSTGIDIYDVQAKTEFRDNKIMDCEYGISLSFIFGSQVYNNTIVNSSTGIFLREDCHTNKVFNNTISSCRESGLYLLDQSSDNSIFNNYFNNSVNVKLENIEGNNTWNSTKMPGNNIIGGPYLGGNFWADLNGSGFSQLSNDSDSDGICDLAYTVNGSDIDYLPLCKPPLFKKWF